VALGIESLPESLYQLATPLYGGVVSVPEDVKAFDGSLKYIFLLIGSMFINPMV
jgi:hypothetical protein